MRECSRLREGHPTWRAIFRLIFCLWCWSVTTSRLSSAVVPHGLILKAVFSPALDVLCVVEDFIITTTNWIEQNIPIGKFWSALVRGEGVEAVVVMPNVQHQVASLSDKKKRSHYWRMKGFMCQKRLVVHSDFWMQSSANVAHCVVPQSLKTSTNDLPFMKTSSPRPLLYLPCCTAWLKRWSLHYVTALTLRQISG